MLTRSFILLALSSLITDTVLAHPHPHLNRRLELPAPISIIANNANTHFGADATGDIKALYDGNTRFRESIKKSGQPDLLKDLRLNGQKPPFVFFGCSDSRVAEGTVFDTKPGEIFSERNIANQFISNDINSVSVLAYGVGHLRARHVVVMGHYGCGGVAAAIASPPVSVIDAGDGALYSWIEPIRQLYLTSTRKEIVDLRNKNGNKTDVKVPDFTDPGFKALVEENVKANVKAIAESPTMRNHYRKLNNPNQKRDENAKQQVWIHGWVYNIENGEIKDLNVTVPPNGPKSVAKPSPAKPTPKPTPKPSPKPASEPPFEFEEDVEIPPEEAAELIVDPDAAEEFTPEELALERSRLIKEGRLPPKPRPLPKEYEYIY